MRFDKVLHVVFSAVMVFLLCFKLNVQNSLITALTIGIFKEWLDKHVLVGHESDVDDIIANMVGIVLGVLLFKFIMKLRRFIIEDT